MRNLQPPSAVKVEVKQGESWNLRRGLRLVGWKCGIPELSEQKTHFYSSLGC